MALPLTVTAVALFYLSAIPIQIAFSLRYDGALRFGAGFSAFEPRRARRRARTASPKKQSAAKKWTPKHPIALLRATLKAFFSLSRHLKLLSLTMDGTVGLSDAAATALICGAANSLDAALFAVTHRARVSLRPDFAAASAHAELSGMISLSVGHIMLAALLGAWEYGLGRLKTWKSIPSKAS